MRTRIRTGQLPQREKGRGKDSVQQLLVNDRLLFEGIHKHISDDAQVSLIILFSLEHLNSNEKMDKSKNEEEEEARLL